MAQQPRHFLSLLDLTTDELHSIVRRASELKRMQHRGDIHTPLKGKNLGMVFEKSSTRTRVSFEVGMSQLGGHALFLSPRDTQLGRGEPFEDSARVLSRMVDIIMIRTFEHEKLELFAEHSRVLGLQGADLLVFPANWPESGKVYPDYIIPTRSIENHVFCIAINRVGKEQETKFPGRSKIVHWFGQPLAEGKNNKEDILYAEIEPAEARRKRLVIAPGKHEVDFINDRRPEFYGPICQVPATTPS